MKNFLLIKSIGNQVRILVVTVKRAILAIFIILKNFCLFDKTLLDRDTALNIKIYRNITEKTMSVGSKEKTANE